VAAQAVPEGPAPIIRTLLATVQRLEGSRAMWVVT
jgi:hypothetical protein